MYYFQTWLEVFFCPSKSETVLMVDFLMIGTINAAGGKKCGDRHQESLDQSHSDAH